MLKTRSAAHQSIATRPAPAEVRCAETVEPRTLLSGNVTAEIVDGVLVLTGDNSTNHIDVVLTQNGTVQITGDATRVNRGFDVVELDIPGGTLAGIDAKLGRGGDHLSIVTEGYGGANSTDLTVIDGDVLIHAGHGHDIIWLEGLDISGHLDVDCGPSNDAVAVKSVKASSIRIVGAHGSDHIGLNGIAAEGDVTVYGSRDADRIVSLGVQSGGITRIQGGDGPDWLVGDIDAVVNGHAGANFARTQIETPLDRSLAAIVVDAVNEAAGDEVLPALDAVDVSTFPDQTDPGDVNPSHAFTQDFTATPSGMYYRIIGESTGANRPTVSSTITVHYEGRLLDGSVFDSSYERQESATFPLANLIPGWKGVIPLMEPGQKIQVFIPPHLGYGAAGSGSIPGNAYLYFCVELIDFSG